MPLNSADLANLELQSAINRHPLVISPQESVLAVIEKMTDRTPQNVNSVSENNGSILDSAGEHAHSCALVCRDREVVGIFTERDIVQLSAAEISLDNRSIAEVMVSPVHTLQESSLKDVFAVLFLFRRHNIRHLPLLDDAGQLVGLISQESLRQILKPANLLKLRRVSDVISHDIVWATPNNTVLHIAKLMAQHRVSCIILVEQESDNRLNPVGIITERDVVQFQCLRVGLGTTIAADVMSSPLIILHPNDSLWHAHKEMQRHHIRRLVVSWNWGQNLGLVTQSSLLKAFDPMEMYCVIETLQQTIQQLEAEKAELQKNLQAET